MGKKWLGPVFWAVALLLAVLAAIIGARWGLSQAPTFAGGDNDGTPATSASRAIYTVFGAVICGLATLALASGIFFLLWARDRRGRVDDGEDAHQPSDMDLSEVQGMFDADEDRVDRADQG